MQLRALFYIFFKILLELFVLDKRVRRVLRGKVCQRFLRPYIEEIESEAVIVAGNKNDKYRIWQYWDKGIHNAPDIVKACIASVEKYRGDVERVILDEETIKDYVKIPDYIYKLKDKGVMSAAHFADIVRTFLLYEYGGCWIDATVYMTAPLPEFIKSSELFVFKNNKDDDADGLNMTNYFISSKGKSIIIAKMKKFLENYWKNNSHIVNYFFYLHAFTLFTESSLENKKEWDEIFYFPYLVVQQMEKELMDKYSPVREAQLESMSGIHKLSYKYNVFARKKALNFADTLYQHIISTYVSDFRGLEQGFRIGLKQKIKSKIAALFSLYDIDDHYVLKLFGLKLCFKHKIQINIPVITKSGITENKRKVRLVVSLTSYPARINTVYQTIKTLLNQTLKPDKLILWLAEEQFPGKSLPENLTELNKFGLEIKWCEDIKSFKKLIPVLKEYPEDIIVTADDDIFYPANFLESLYNQYLKYPQYIHANRAFLIKKDKYKNSEFVMKSRGYAYDETYFPSCHNEFMTGYGTLFPPHCLDKEVLNSNIFMKLTPTKDDLWFWRMAVKKGTKVCVNPDGYKLKLINRMMK